MNITDTTFKTFLEKLPISLQLSIKDAIAMLTSDDAAIDDDLLKMLQKINPETYNTIMQGLSNSESESKEILQFKFLNEQFKDLDFLNQTKEDIIIWNDHFETENNLFIDNTQMVIINGNVSCNNLIVLDSYLFVNGNINCNILFGASGNDKMTHISNGIKAKSVIENGHYTLVNGKINSENVIMLHNEIKSNQEIIADVIFDVTALNGKNLNSEIIDNDGFFDEEKFLEKINSNQNFHIL